MKKILFLSLFTGMAFHAQSQQVLSDQQYKEYAENVVVHADPRLDLVLAKKVEEEPVSTTNSPSIITAGINNSAAGTILNTGEPPKPTGFIGRTRGYRVQIYSGTDRAKATQVKLAFMRQYPGEGAYMTYISPQYRVKVGDFTNRAAAAKLYRELISSYSPCMIINDVVEVNTFKNKKQ